MGKLFDIGPFRIMINTKDHLPPHVHCVGPGVMVKIEILTGTAMVNYGVRAKDVRILTEWVLSHQDVCITEWRRIHG